MEKMPNMSNVDELCVKYVFDELDPSENLIVEQAMIKDQNLLIEVESLRSTWRKIRNIPEFHPPGTISRTIIRQAKDHSDQQQLFSSGWRNPGLMATAAVFLFSLLITTAYLLPGKQTDTSGLPADHASVSATPTPELTRQDLSRLSGYPAPWIDRRNMIYLDQKNLPGSIAATDSMYHNRVSSSGIAVDPIIIPPSLFEIQLTGTQY